MVYENAGQYLVALVVTSDKGCKDIVLKPILIEDDFGIYVPDAFTPNGDGLNDTFSPKGYRISNFQMNIYDRWGGKLFSSSEIENGWNGTFQNRGGDVLKQDIYVWKIHLIDVHGKIYDKAGYVTLIK